MQAITTRVGCLAGLLCSLPLCRQAVGGTTRVTVLPANDLRGLVGQPNVPLCPGQRPDVHRPCRWVGGHGHELGHPLGLSHPPVCHSARSCPDDALMWMRFPNYPDTPPLPEDKPSPNANPFFAQISLPASLPGSALSSPVDVAVTQ